MQTISDKVEKSRKYWSSIPELKTALLKNRDRLLKLEPDSVEYNLMDNNIRVICQRLGQLHRGVVN